MFNERFEVFLYSLNKPTAYGFESLNLVLLMIQTLIVWLALIPLRIMEIQC